MFEETRDAVEQRVEPSIEYEIPSDLSAKLGEIRTQKYKFGYFDGRQINTSKLRVKLFSVGSGWGLVKVSTGTGKRRETHLFGLIDRDEMEQLAQEVADIEGTALEKGRL